MYHFCAPCRHTITRPMCGSRCSIILAIQRFVSFFLLLFRPFLAYILIYIFLVWILVVGPIFFLSACRVLTPVFFDCSILFPRLCSFFSVLFHSMAHLFRQISILSKRHGRFDFSFRNRFWCLPLHTYAPFSCYYFFLFFFCWFPFFFLRHLSPPDLFIVLSTWHWPFCLPSITNVASGMRHTDNFMLIRF